MKSSHNVFLERDFTVGETACASPACHRRASVSGLRKGEGVPVAGHLLGGLWLPRMPGDRPCGDAGRPWWPGGGRGVRGGARGGARGLAPWSFSRSPGPLAPTQCEWASSNQLKVLRKVSQEDALFPQTGATPPDLPRAPISVHACTCTPTHTRTQSPLVLSPWRTQTTARDGSKIQRQDIFCYRDSQQNQPQLGQ